MTAPPPTSIAASALPTNAPAARRTRDAAASARIVVGVDDAHGNYRPPCLTVQVREGSAAHILTQERNTAQLLVVASHGLGEIADLLLGLDHRPLRRAPQCSVLMVHESDRP